MIYLEKDFKERINALIKMKAYLPMIIILIIIVVLTGAMLFVFKKYYKLSRSRARKIEILGYYLLFIVLVWEFIIKNLVMGSFYNADLFYIDQKLNYIFQALNHITENEIYIPTEVIDGFYNSQSVEYLQKQLFFGDLIESLLKISSTVFIAVGRFYELAKKKEKE